MTSPSELDLDDLEDSPVPHRVRMSGHGKPLLEYVLALLEKLPEAEIREAVREGRFRRDDGSVVAASSVLRFDETLHVELDRAVADDPFLPPPKRPLPILFEDAHLIAVDKPPGLLSYPIGPRRVSALTIVERQLAARGEPTELRPLHRIDRETSGVLIMARQLEADRRIKRAFQEKQLRKSYLALVRGSVERAEFQVDAPIGSDADGPIRIKMAVREDGRPAATHFEVLERFGERCWGASGKGYSWVRAHPITGRTHQIRVHLAHLGHPIVGDKIYCDDGVAFLRRWDGVMDADDLERLELPRHALHARSLGLKHPMEDRELALRAPIPQDLKRFTVQRGGDPSRMEGAAT